MIELIIEEDFSFCRASRSGEIGTTEFTDLRASRAEKDTAHTADGQLFP